MNNIVLQIRDLVIGYDKPIVGPIDDTIERNELLILIGPNGSGKSTLLRTLAGILPPISGEIALDGKPLQAYSLKELSTKRAIFTPKYEGYLNYNLRELLTISRYPFTNWLGSLKKADKDLIDQSLEITGLKDLWRRRIYELSDGERQKLTIARAYCQDTDLIFFDEPFVHLDLKQKTIMYHLISELATKHNKTLVLATHDLDFAKDFGERVMAILENGKTQFLEHTELSDNKLNKIFAIE